MASGLISANVRKLADKHGWDNFLVRSAEELRWERVRALWWLWSIFGLSGGITLALWLTPLIVGPQTVGPQSDENARQIVELRAELSSRQTELDQAKQQFATAQQRITSLQSDLQGQKDAVNNEKQARLAASSAHRRLKPHWPRYNKHKSRLQTGFLISSLP
jgi:multidrug efflux pump subunit AcrA (membrane-fusion protein)